ncbi:type II 3-dehydroquinate dehydratase [Geminicoccaceae bacterium 1502E]|uniref:3-dehydroquinate dehydratase n=1 Tax=Marinimicrococcus flavescens TaxID=3031815 RepID=A0AAP4D5X1_9PROT|nr:type II 3-dehydroquinate dehydratase [Marinimicrococcus flavescens]MDX6748972.1 type II 3-dehydroquinate dehydratase [Geminicoccaceae bacterium 1502E]
MLPSILVLNGPNLNLLGQREPELYGRETLDDVRRLCEREGETLGLRVDFRQSNHEGVLVDWVHEARGTAAGLLVNAGAYSHTSLALHDALRAFEGPILEVHLSNIYRREAFRHHSYVSLAATGVICGLGSEGYRIALQALRARLAAAAG